MVCNTVIVNQRHLVPMHLQKRKRWMDWPQLFDLNWIKLISNCSQQATITELLVLYFVFFFGIFLQFLKILIHLYGLFFVMFFLIFFSTVLVPPELTECNRLLIQYIMLEGIWASLLVHSALKYVNWNKLIHTNMIWVQSK